MFPAQFHRPPRNATRWLTCPQFDDLPSFSPSNNDTADYPPIFNPYHHLYFSGGYAYAPPPTDPFQPVSKPHLAVFNGINIDSSEADVLGEFGAGPKVFDSAFWIDAYGAYMGCDNKGPADCVVTFSAFTYTNRTGQEILQASWNVTIPPCPALNNCVLQPVTLPSDGFTGLSGLRIVARVNDKPVIWFMDDVSLAWSNTTCAAAAERASTR